MYTKEMLESIKKVEANRAANAALEPRRMTAEEKDELLRALKEYKGSILCVSHENEFYSELVTDVWNCEDWTLKIV